MDEYINLTEDGGVKKHIIREGSGDTPADHLEVEVHYVGSLENGTIFDSSRKSGETFKFTLGEGQVIRGWDIGVKSMKHGEIADLLLSPDYAYGSSGAGSDIPPNSTLKFNVELINFSGYVDVKYDLSVAEKLHNARLFKEQGVEFFKAKDYENAISKFLEGFSYVEKTSPEVITQEIKDIHLSLLLNISNCYNNLKNFQGTVQTINRAMMITRENPKSYYYRAIAYVNLNELDLAQDDYLSLEKLVPADDPGVIYLRQLVGKNNKNLFKKLFKDSLYDDIPVIENPKNIPQEINPLNPQVFFDLQVGEDLTPKRIEFELFADKTPLTAENFRALCTGEKGESLHYKNSIFHRIIKGFMMQGGDFENANGTGGKSIYGEKFADENFIYKHSTPGLLSMANSGPNTNGSQFFITFQETSWLDGKHVVFGKVTKGMEFVKEIENMETNGQDVPVAGIKIIDCGQL